MKLWPDNWWTIWVYRGAGGIQIYRSRRYPPGVYSFGTIKGGTLRMACRMLTLWPTRYQREDLLWTMWELLLFWRLFIFLLVVEISLAVGSYLMVTTP